ncbi:MAG: NAD/NADP octopine/nopaline dehydrogenase family protein [Spirochaetota bacterium]|nr:MAG: NAD/NADP octopine/nopaline dehydrogenase family protein [Spirochaetota bacterium]
MKSLPKVTVCGGGRAGTAIAGDLALMGCEVNLFQIEEFGKSIEPIIERGGIEITGETQSGKNGFAKLNLVTTDASEAFKGVDMIMVAVPAFGQEAFFNAFSPCLEEGQVILTNTPYWACLRFAGKLKGMGILDRITLAETAIMPYLSDILKPTATHIYKTKQDVPIAAFPANKTDAVLDVVGGVYPQFKKVKNVLWTSLGCLNTPVHPTLSVPMAGLMFDRYRGGCRFYGEATIPGGRLLEAYDKERLAVARKVGAELVSEAEAFFKAYGYKAANIAEALRKSDHSEMFVDVDFQKALLIEDIRYFYVLLSELGSSLGVPTPVTNGIIDLMGVMLDIDYREGATTLEDVGLAGLNAEQIVSYVTKGEM